MCASKGQSTETTGQGLKNQGGDIDSIGKQKENYNGLSTKCSKKEDIIKDGGALSLGVKREYKSIDLRAQKMMKGTVEPSKVPIVVQAIRQTVTIPQMTSPQERQPREQRQEIP